MADFDTTQQVDVEKLLAEADAIIANSQLKRAERGAKREAHEKLLAEARAIIANSQLKRAEREAKAAAREAMKKKMAEAKAAAREAMADSGTAQHADIKKLLDSAAAIITNIQLNREELDEAEWEEAIAEVKRLHREAREKLFANSRRKANLLPTGAELACVSFLFGSLVAKALF